MKEEVISALKEVLKASESTFHCSCGSLLIIKEAHSPAALEVKYLFLRLTWLSVGRFLSQTGREERSSA